MPNIIALYHDIEALSREKANILTLVRTLAEAGDYALAGRRLAEARILASRIAALRDSIHASLSAQN